MILWDFSTYNYAGTLKYSSKSLWAGLFFKNVSSQLQRIYMYLLKEQNKFYQNWLVYFLVNDNQLLKEFLHFI
jgi:hypothetical protein